MRGAAFQASRCCHRPPLPGQSHADGYPLQSHDELGVYCGARIETLGPYRPRHKARGGTPVGVGHTVATWHVLLALAIFCTSAGWRYCTSGAAKHKKITVFWFNFLSAALRIIADDVTWLHVHVPNHAVKVIGGRWYRSIASRYGSCLDSAYKRSTNRGVLRGYPRSVFYCSHVSGYVMPACSLSLL